MTTNSHQGHPLPQALPLGEDELPEDLGAWLSDSQGSGVQDGMETWSLCLEVGLGAQRARFCFWKLWGDDCLHAAVSKDQKQAERILLHSDHVESICLHWKLHENKSKPRRMFSGPRSVTTLRLLPAERKGASHQNQKNQVPKPSRHTAKEWIFVSIS